MVEVIIEDGLKQRFKRARKALGLTQKQVAKILAVSQPQVFDYEAPLGTTPTEAQVVKLETRAHQSTEELANLERASIDRRANPDYGQPSPFCSDESLSLHIRSFVRDWEEWNKEKDAGAKDPCDIYLFGSDGDDLPIFEDSGVQQLWAENLKRGVNYHLVWTLDGSRPAELAEAYNTLTRVVIHADGGDPSSCIHVHGILLNGPENSRSGDAPTDEGDNRIAIKTEYEKLRNVARPRLQLEELIDLRTYRNGEYARRLRLIRLGGSVPTILCHVAIDLEKRPAKSMSVLPPESFAARREEDVSPILRGKPITGWLFLSPSARKKIVQDIGVLTTDTNTASPRNEKT